MLGRDDNVGKHPLRVDVTGQQFAVVVPVPRGNAPRGRDLLVLRLPVDTSIDLHMHALDVIHSFWVPELAQKQDAVPGLEPTLHITPAVGTYQLICTELCGLGHAAMRSTVIVMPKAAFAKWMHGQTAAASSGSGATLGKMVFTNSGCSACHTFTPAGSSGKVGPDLDKLSAGGADGPQGPRRLHRGVHRPTERVRSAWISAERDAPDLREDAEQGAARRTGPVPRRIREEGGDPEPVTAATLDITRPSAGAAARGATSSARAGSASSG